MRGVTPALSACRRPLHRRLVESEKPPASPQRSPEFPKSAVTCVSGTECNPCVRYAMILPTLLSELREIPFAHGWPCHPKPEGRRRECPPSVTEIPCRVIYLPIWRGICPQIYI